MKLMMLLGVLAGLLIGATWTALPTPQFQVKSAEGDTLVTCDEHGRGCTLADEGSRQEAIGRAIVAATLHCREEAR